MIGNTMLCTVGSEPSTNITSSPPPVSAWQRATFQFYSPDTEVVKMEWKLDGGPYKELACPGVTVSSHCKLHIPLLAYGRHRLDARAVSNIGLADASPAYVEWEINHCNDPSRRPVQYAKIGSDGALECIDCPHDKGAECMTLGTFFSFFLRFIQSPLTSVRSFFFVRVQTPRGNMCTRRRGGGLREIEETRIISAHTKWHALVGQHLCK